MPNVVEYNRLDQLEALRTAWENLLAQTPNATYFQSLDWLGSFWRQCGAGRRLRVFVAWEYDQPTGILPLNVRFGRRLCGSPATLSFPFDGWGSFYGPIGPDSQATLHAVLQHLHRTPRDYDLVDLSPSRCPGDLLDPSLAPRFTPVGCAAQIELSADWHAYWESRRKDPNRRRNVERCERRLAERGQLSYMRYRPAGRGQGDADARWDLYDACEQLARISWQAALRDGNTLSHAHVREFLRAAHVAAVNAGAVDLNLLLLDGRPIAFLYGYHYRGNVELIRTGFDPDLASLAPGNALWTRTIRDSFERGDRIIDLGPTCLDYKRFWMTSTAPVFQYREIPLSPRSQLLRAALWLRSKMTRPRSDTNAAAKQAVADRQAARTSDRLRRQSAIAPKSGRNIPDEDCKPDVPCSAS